MAAPKMEPHQQDATDAASAPGPSAIAAPEPAPPSTLPPPSLDAQVVSTLQELEARVKSQFLDKLSSSSRLAVAGLFGALGEAAGDGLTLASLAQRFSTLCQEQLASPAAANPTFMECVTDLWQVQCRNWLLRVPVIIMFQSLGHFL